MGFKKVLAFEHLDLDALGDTMTAVTAAVRTAGLTDACSRIDARSTQQLTGSEEPLGCGSTAPAPSSESAQPISRSPGCAASQALLSASSNESQAE